MNTVTDWWPTLAGICAPAALGSSSTLSTSGWTPDGRLMNGSVSRGVESSLQRSGARARRQG